MRQTKNYYETFDGIVLFIRKHRESDLLIKLFTRQYGKRMFFIKRALKPNHPLKHVAFPFLQGQFIGRVNTGSLSFINDVSDIVYPKETLASIETHAYATYVCNLVDACMEDNEVDDRLFDLLQEYLDKLEEGLDPVILTNIFEIQLLPKFGVFPQLHHCVFSGQTSGIFDYSMAYGGLISEQFFYRDERRLHWHPRAAHFIRLFSQIKYSEMNTIRVSQETKQWIRGAIDELYEEYVGIHLKSRSFIDQLEKLNQSLDDKPSDKV